MMGLLASIRSRFAGAGSPPRASAADGGQAIDISDPNLRDFMRTGGSGTASGAVVTPMSALQVTAVFRCIDIISSSMGMLPCYLMRKGTDGERTEAVDHPLYDLLMYEPNGWQTPFEFKSTMQARALVDGDAFALVVWSVGRPIRLIPLRRGSVRVEQRPDYSVVYHYTRPDGGIVPFGRGEILHLRGFGLDGVRGLERVRLAREAIGLALRAEEAAARLFKDGQLAGGAIQGDNKLSPEAHARLVASMQSRHAGAENAGKWFVLEEGFKASVLGGSAVDNQHIETRKHQVEEVARPFGVPRPLLMVDETAWGSGIEQLATLFVRFALSPWMIAWEQAIAFTCLARNERRTLYADFDEQELLRGSMKDQAEFFSKAMGSGGRGAWLVANEVRRATGYGPIEGGDKLSQPAPAPTTTPNNGNIDNEPPDPAGNQGV